MALTRTTQQNEELTMPAPFIDAFPAILAAFRNVGRVHSVQEKFGRIAGSIGSGVFNMNRADVTVIVQPDGPDRSKVVFVATAQEGLISQNTAAKAISRLLEALKWRTLP